MGWNNVGWWRLEGNSTIRFPVAPGNHWGEDFGAQICAADPKDTFDSTAPRDSVGWVSMVDQQKAKDFNTGQTWYFVTLTNLEPWGVEGNFQGGGF